MKRAKVLLSVVMLAASVGVGTAPISSSHAPSTAVTMLCPPAC